MSASIMEPVARAKCLLLKCAASLILMFWVSPAYAQVAIPPAVDCAVAKPIVVESSQFASLYRVMSAVGGAAKSEWETTETYISRRQNTLNTALAKSLFKCPRFIVKVPLKWRYDANKGLLNTYRGGYNETNWLGLDDLEADLGPNTGGVSKSGGGLFDDIYVGEVSIEAEFAYQISRYNAAPKPKTQATIAKCLQGALSYPGMYGYELCSAWCTAQQWDVDLMISNARHLPGSFAVSVEEAKRLRATGVFIYVDVTLSYNYIGSDDMRNKWEIYSSLNGVYIGDAHAEAIRVVSSLPSTIIPPDWSARPSASDLERFYPDRAQRLGLDGRATVTCQVKQNGTLVDCSVESEDPPDMGFGDATIRASRLFKMRPQIEYGQPVDGGTFRFSLDWKLPL